MIKTFKDLTVWQKAHQLVLEVYRVSACFPKDERYGLTAQIRRAAASIPANIVEGFKRKSKKEYAQFISIADGSLEETKYHILLARDLGYLPEREFSGLTIMCDEIGRMLFGFRRTLLPTTYHLRLTTK